MWSVKLPLLGLITKYKKWEVYWIKNSENWATRVQVVPSCMFMYLSWPLTAISHSKVYLISVSGQPSGFIDFLYQAMIQWLRTGLLNHLRKNQRSISFMWPSGPLASHLSVTYLSLFSLQLNWLILLTQLTLHWVTQFIYNV